METRYRITFGNLPVNPKNESECMTKEIGCSTPLEKGEIIAVKVDWFYAKAVMVQICEVAAGPSEGENFVRAVASVIA